MMTYSEKRKQHKIIVLQMFNKYCHKSKEYGDSYFRVRLKFPEAILFRLNERLNRLESLYNKKQNDIYGEAIDEILMNIANDCIMELIERKADMLFISSNLPKVLKEEERKE